jgi:hypothetical protein
MLRGNPIEYLLLLQFVAIGSALFLLAWRLLSRVMGRI